MRTPFAATVGISTMQLAIPEFARQNWPCPLMYQGPKHQAEMFKDALPGATGGCTGERCPMWRTADPELVLWSKYQGRPSDPYPVPPIAPHGLEWRDNGQDSDGEAHFQLTLPADKRRGYCGLGGIPR